MSRKSQYAAFSFGGFDNPTTTPVPDVVFDQFLAVLSEAELKALLYIIRRTFGFKRDRNPISFNQFLNGITTHDGRSLDQGCGIRSRTTLSAALKSLEQKGIIRSDKGVDEQGENVTTVYSLRFRDGALPSAPPDEAPEEPLDAAADRPLLDGKNSGNPPEKIPEKPAGVVRNSYHRSTKFGARGGTKFVLRSTEFVPGVVRNSYPQQTVLRQTDVVINTPAILDYFGVEKQKAEKLIQNYSPEYIREKADLLAWKQRHPGRGRRIGDPAAWLVRAIEQDYRPPPGFRPEPRATAPASTDTAEPVAPPSRRQRALAALRRAHETTEEEVALWAQTLEEIRLATTQATFQTWFSQTEVLSLRNDRALIAVPNRATKEWLLGRLSVVVQRALQSVLGRPVATELIVYDE